MAGLISLVVFVALSLLLFLLIYIIVPKKTVLEERLDDLRQRPQEVSALSRQMTPGQQFLDKIGKYLPLNPEYKGKYGRMLVAAGFKRERVPVFIGAKILFAVGVPAIYLIFYGIPVEKEFNLMVLASAGLAIAGFLLPSFWLSRKVKNRQLEIFHSLPDVLDLMMICVESGLSMEAAMLRVSEDKHHRDTALGMEMRQVIQETRAGMPRHEALKGMGERTMVDDVKAFAAMLIMTEKFGTSLARALRVHSDSLRTQRRQRAEEMAAKTAIKLLFPLVFLIFPALFIVMLLPALIRIYKFFGNL